MPNITDVFATLHDSLAGLMKPAAGSAMLMSWPGFALSPADFKPAAHPDGPYDPQVAAETFSRISDMAPLPDELRFEDSGFEIHNLYQALIFGAMFGPNSSPSASKLLLDAQFNFQQAVKASIEDPTINYYPARATPLDWYSETSPGWQPFALGPQQIQPPVPTSPFVKLGGLQLVNQGALRVASPAVTTTKLQAALQTTITAKPVLAVAAAKPMAPKMAMMARVNPDVTPVSVAQIDVSKLSVARSVGTIDKRVILNRVLLDQMPKTTIQQTTDNWSISFRYCLVNVNRDYLNATLLSLPGWFFPGTQAGHFTTQFPSLPTSFLAIRDLRIAANWAPQDLKTVSDAVSFGPFDVRSKTVVQNELRAPGLQIVAWAVKKNPQLAPMKDPNLP